MEFQILLKAEDEWKMIDMEQEIKKMRRENIIEKVFKYKEDLNSY